MAHLGCPKGQVSPAFSLASVATYLAELSGVKVTLALDIVDPFATETVAVLGRGEITLLENVYYDTRETSKVDEERGELVREYAKLGDAFVSDGFGVVRHKQVSVYNIAKILSSAISLFVLKEIEPLSKVTGDPERPHDVTLGSPKAPGELGVIANLLKKTDVLSVDDGMAFTFLAAQGHSVSKSLFEENQIEIVKGHIAEAAERGVDLVLPIDVVVALKFAADAPTTAIKTDTIPDDRMGLGIGPESVRLFADKLTIAKTVVWNDPTGVFEFDAFAGGTRAVAETLSTDSMFSTIDGGGPAAVVHLLGFGENTLPHISTGGNVSLELLKGKVLPDIAVLEG